MRGAPLAAFVLGVCVLQWQAQLPPWPVLLAGAVTGVIAAAASLRTKVSGRAAIGLACAAALLLGFSSKVSATKIMTKVTPERIVLRDNSLKAKNLRSIQIWEK